MNFCVCLFKHERKMPIGSPWCKLMVVLEEREFLDVKLIHLY
jgi:hypothetical protein